jgi:CPA2 family monovalent cation:H+ antiporter-2
LEADLQPFKGLLLGLFFMTVGVGINFLLLVQSPLVIVGLVLGLIVLKAAVLFVVAMIFGIKGRDRMLLTLGMAQGGEFGFLILTVGLSEGALPLDVAQMAQLVIGLSMLLTPVLFLGYEALARRLAALQPDLPADEIDEQGTVIIAGIGRFGQVVNRLVRHSGLKTVVLDADIGIIETMRRFGVKGFFGDPSRPELLEAAGIMKAQVMVVAVDNKEKAIEIVRHVRSRRPDIHIVARARDRVHVFELYQAGANDIVRETFDSSVRAGRYVLENMGYSDYEASTLSQAFYRLDRSGMRALAEVWVPGLRSDMNPAYIARAKELDHEMETELARELDEARPKSA